MKHLPMILFLLFMVSGITTVTSCKDDEVTEPTLYDTLGGSTMVTDPSNPTTKIEAGQLAIRSVVDSTIFVIAADSRINSFFQVLLAEVTAGDLSGFQDLSNELTTFFSAATGSKNIKYTGLSMQAAHNPSTNSRMNGKSTNAHFDAFVDDLVKGAQQNGVPTNVIQSIGALVETQRTLVVQQ